MRASNRAFSNMDWNRTVPRSLSGLLCLYTFDIGLLYVAARYFEIVMGLEIQPELWAITKVKAEPERSVCRNASTIVDDLGNAVW